METLVTQKVSIVLRANMEVQERILQKATGLFVRYGMRSITMDEIALQLGISKKTIYQFFADKNELVDAVLLKMLEHNQYCCKKDSAVADNAIHEVFLAMEMVYEMFENMNPSMLYDLEKYHPKTYEKFTQHKYKFLYSVIKENLERGVKEEIYRPDIDVNIMTMLRLETLMFPFSTHVIGKTKYNISEIHIHVIEHFLFGIASIKGYKLILKYKEERKKISAL